MYSNTYLHIITPYPVVNLGYKNICVLSI